MLDTLSQHSDTLTTAVVGSAACGATEVALPDGTLHLVIQTLIGLITIIKLLRGKKTKSNN